MGLNWGRLGQFIPGVSTVQDIAHGDWKKAGKNLATGGISDAAGALKGGVEEKYNDWFKKPYDQEREGYDAVQSRIEQLKKERMGQKDYAYNLADSKYEPARKAMQAVYGDPSTWKL